MRHRRGTLLARDERLFDLQHFGALQMTHFDGDTFQRTTDQRQGGKEDGVTVARHNLSGHGLRIESETGADESFNFGVNVREGADRARDLAEGNFLSSLE